MRLMSNMLLQPLHQSRLANACIPSEQDYLSMPSFDLCPTFQEECDFRFSTHQRCESSGCSHIETPPGSAFLEDVVHVDRLRDTSERLGSQVLTREVALD